MGVCGPGGRSRVYKSKGNADVAKDKDGGHRVALVLCDNPHVAIVTLAWFQRLL